MRTLMLRLNNLLLHPLLKIKKLREQSLEPHLNQQHLHLNLPLNQHLQLNTRNIHPNSNTNLK